MVIDAHLRKILPISMTSYFFVSCWSFLVPLIQRDLGFLYIEIGLVVAVSTVSSLATRLLMGSLADRFGPAYIIKFSLFVLSLASFGLIFCPSQSPQRFTWFQLP
jgi:MFS family permease